MKVWADLTSNKDFCLLRMQHRLLNVLFSFAFYSFIIKENIKNVCVIRKLYYLIILISISVSNWLKSFINIDVYLSATIYHMSTFCISYLNVEILLQDSLKNCIPYFHYNFFFKSYNHKICTSRLPIFWIK